MYRMVIIETPLFTRIIGELMSDDAYRQLQEALIQRPEKGDLIPGSGGLRKVRWKLEGQGQRGGVRIIYYCVATDEQPGRVRIAYLFRGVDAGRYAVRTLRIWEMMVRGAYPTEE